MFQFIFLYEAKPALKCLLLYNFVVNYLFISLETYLAFKTSLLFEVFLHSQPKMLPVLFAPSQQLVPKWSTFYTGSHIIVMYVYVILLSRTERYLLAPLQHPFNPGSNHK